jgi:hypothetical protein
VADISELKKKTGINFKNPDLLELALIHSSYINENPEAASDSNERLSSGRRSAGTGYCREAVPGLSDSQKASSPGCAQPWSGGKNWRN